MASPGSAVHSKPGSRPTRPIRDRGAVSSSAPSELVSRRSTVNPLAALRYTTCRTMPRSVSFSGGLDCAVTVRPTLPPRYTRRPLGRLHPPASMAAALFGWQGVTAPEALPSFLIPARRFQGHQAGADRGQHDPGAIVHAHLAVNGRDVVFHRVGADEQLLGNFRVGQAASHFPQHVHFPRRQPFGPARSFAFRHVPSSPSPTSPPP